MLLLTQTPEETAQTMHQLENTSTITTLWQELHQACDHNIALAQNLGSRLRDGASGPELTPLLKEATEQVDHLRAGIRNLAHRAGPLNPTERDRLLGQMRMLLDLEEENHALLSAKGIRLTTPQSYRYRAQGRKRQSRNAPAGPYRS